MGAVMYGARGEKSEKQKASGAGDEFFFSFFDVLPFFFSGRGNMYTLARGRRKQWAKFALAAGAGTKRVFPGTLRRRMQFIGRHSAGCGRHYDGAAALWCCIFM
jgi:hypothetical protein